MRLSPLIAAAALLLAASPTPSPAADKAWFGVGFRTELSGYFWNPTLDAVSLAVVAPGSPAAGQGLAVGDRVLEIEGIPVAGATGEQLKKLRAILERKVAVGDTLRLKLSRNGGEPWTAELAAALRPEQP